MSPAPWIRRLGLAGLCLIYITLGKLGLYLAVVNPSATAIWAPTGIAIAAFLLWGQRVWPAIFIGAFVVNLTTTDAIASSLAIAVGNTLEGVFGATLAVRFANGRKAFDRAGDIFRFAVFTGLLATAISALIGTAALWANGLAKAADLTAIWATWWLGDATGAVLVTPIVVLWHDRPRLRWPAWQALETGLVALGFGLVALGAFSVYAPVGMYDYPLFLIAMPVVLWSAFRLSAQETTTAIGLLAVGAIAGTLLGVGPFARYSPPTAVLLLEVFMAFLILTGLVVSAVVRERRQAEETLAQREQLYRLAVESASDAIVTIDPDSIITYANLAAHRTFGYRPEELIGQSLTMLIPERLREEHLRGFQRYLETGAKNVPWQPRELIGLHRSGREIPLEISYGEQTDGRRLFTGVLRDIAERQRTESVQRWLATLIASSNDAVIGKNLDGVVQSWNLAAETMYGYPAEEMIGQPIKKLYPPERTAEYYLIMNRMARGRPITHFETERVCKDGRRLHVSITVSPIKDGSGRIIGASSVARDITGKKEAERQMQFLAHHDALTGLPNRVLFREELARRLAEADTRQQLLALLFIDLDHFKAINDTHGHSVGDELLKAVAGRLQHSLRSCDLVARLGGDEFVIILVGDSDATQSELIAQKVLENLLKPIRLTRMELTIAASIGISLYPRDGADADQLMRSADTAMYHVKENGRARFQRFSQRLNCRIRTQADLAQRLEQAVDRDELRLAYQPQINFNTGRVLAVEALLRWNSTLVQTPGPAEFIPVAEESGAIQSIGDWVLQQACKDLKRWRHNGHADLRMAVNLSRRQLHRAEFSRWLRELLQQVDLPPEALELELPEAVWNEFSPGHLAQLTRLQEFGVHLTMDGFGTGQTTLLNLQRYPVRRLKIDRSLIAGMDEDAAKFAAIGTIARCAQSLQIDAVATGVESREQLQRLQELGLRAGQGHYFHPPLSAEQIGTELLARAPGH